MENFLFKELDGMLFRKPLIKKKLHTSNFPYVFKKDREQGEKELSDLVETSNKECVWLYSADDSLWYSIGFETIKKEKEGTIRLGVVTYDVDMSKIGKNVSHYHIHPKYAENESYKMTMKDARKEDKYKKKNPIEQKAFEKIIQNSIAIIASIPSKEDIDAYVYFFSKYSKKCELDFKIASPYGVLTVEFPNKADLDSVCEVYEKRFEKVRGSVMNYHERDAVFDAVHKINQLMKDLLKISIDDSLV